MVLTFEYEPDHILEINFDASGRDELVRILTALSDGDHEHLSTPSWGGYHLSEDFPNPDLVPIHQVTMQLVASAEGASADG